MLKTTLPLALVLLLVAAIHSAATPPALINYQGVLRDAGGDPRTGNFDMVFRFYSAASGGTLLLTDTHNAAAPSGQVAVSNGLFTTGLGAGTIAAGAEPTLANVFANRNPVYLEIQVETETLSPRVLINAAAYAQNATTLAGNAASAFATAAHNQSASTITTGTLAVVRGGTGLSSPGTSGYVLTSNGSGWTSSALPAEGDGIVGNEVTNATNATLVRSGSGTGASPYTLALNLGSVNTWTAQQTFGSAQVTGTLKDTSGSAGTSGQILKSNGTTVSWANAAAVADPWVGNEVTNATNATLTRTGSGSSSSPFTLGLNLANTNTWTASQSFSAPTYFTGNGTWDASGNVGIGTTIPTARLSVNGSMSVNTYAGEALDQSQSVGDRIWNGNTNWQSFTAGATGALTEVDVYLDSPYAASDGTGILRIYSGEGTGGTLLAQQNILISNIFELKFYPIANPPQVTSGQVYTLAITVPGYDQQWFETQTGNPYSGGRFGSDSTQDALFKTWVSAGTGGGLTVTSGGTVGLGHSNPAFPLTFATEYGDKISLYGNSGTHMGFGAQPNLLQVHGSSASDAIVFGYGRSDSFTEVMRVRGNGNVGIGTTDPKCALHVNGSGWFSLDSGSLGTAATQGVRVFMDNAASPLIGRIMSYDYAGGASLHMTLQHTGGYVGIGNITPAYKLQVSSDSAAKPNGGSWTNPSDFRLKKNIRPFTDGLAVIDRINPVRYQYNGKGGMPQDLEGIGVVAQDMQAVAPYTVGTFRAKMDAVDAAETDLYDFNASALTFVLINAVKELDARTKGLAGKGTEAPASRAIETAPRAVEGKASVQLEDASAEAFHPGGPAAVLEVSSGVRAGEVLVIVPNNGADLHPCLAPADPMVVGVALADASDGRVPVAASGFALVKADATLAPIARGDLLATSGNPGHAMKAQPVMVNGFPMYSTGTVLGKALEGLDAGTGTIRVMLMPR